MAKPKRVEWCYRIRTTWMQIVIAFPDMWVTLCRASAFDWSKMMRSYANLPAPMAKAFGIRQQQRTAMQNSIVRRWPVRCTSKGHPFSVDIIRKLPKRKRNSRPIIGSKPAILPHSQMAFSKSKDDPALISSKLADTKLVRWKSNHICWSIRTFQMCASLVCPIQNGVNESLRLLYANQMRPLQVEKMRWAWMNYANGAKHDWPHIKYQASSSKWNKSQRIWSANQTKRKLFVTTSQMSIWMSFPNCNSKNMLSWPADAVWVKGQKHLLLPLDLILIAHLFGKNKNGIPFGIC